MPSLLRVSSVQSGLSVASVRLEFILMGKRARQYVSLDSRRAEHIRRAYIQRGIYENVNREGSCANNCGSGFNSGLRGRSLCGLFQVTMTEIFKTVTQSDFTVAGSSF